MAKKFPLHPKNPERVCWGCDKYCPADSLACGNGSERTQHPVELFGDDWHQWGIDAEAPAEKADEPARASTENKTESQADEQMDEQARK